MHHQARPSPDFLLQIHSTRQASVLADVRENGENNKFIHAMDYLLSLNSFDIWTLRYHALRLDGCAMCVCVC